MWEKIRHCSLFFWEVYELVEWTLNVHYYKAMLWYKRLCSQLKMGLARRQPIPLSFTKARFTVKKNVLWSTSNWYSFWFVDRFSCGDQIALNEKGDEGEAGNPTVGDTSLDEAHSQQVSKHTRSWINPLMLLMNEGVKVYSVTDLLTHFY